MFHNTTFRDGVHLYDGFPTKEISDTESVSSAWHHYVPMSYMHLSQIPTFLIILGEAHESHNSDNTIYLIAFNQYSIHTKYMDIIFCKHDTVSNPQTYHKAFYTICGKVL